MIGQVFVAVKPHVKTKFVTYFPDPWLTPGIMKLKWLKARINNAHNPSCGALEGRDVPDMGKCRVRRCPRGKLGNANILSCGATGVGVFLNGQVPREMLSERVPVSWTAR